MSVSATRSVTNTPRGIGPKTRDVTTLWLMRRARAREMSSGPMRLTATAPGDVGEPREHAQPDVDVHSALPRPCVLSAAATACTMSRRSRPLERTTDRGLSVTGARETGTSG